MMRRMFLRILIVVLAIHHGAASASSNVAIVSPFAAALSDYTSRAIQTSIDARSFSFFQTRDPRSPPGPTSLSNTVASLRGGSFLIPSGWNPLGYKISSTGEEFLAFDDSLTCDVGRFLASLKSSRKRRSALKAAWLEIVRVSKTSQSMRIYRNIDKLLAFCLKTGMID